MGIKPKNCNQFQVDSEEKFLQQLIDKLPVGIQIFDISGLTRFINKKQVELLGIEDNNIAVGKFNVLTDPYSVANGSALFYKEVFKEKKTVIRNFTADFNIEENNWDTVKGKRYFHECAFPILDEYGNMQRVVAVLSDFTDDKLSNEELLNSERRFRSIFENAVSGIAFTDTHGNIILSNKSFQNLIGYNSDELIQKKFSDITHEEDRQKEADLMRCAIESKEDSCRMEKRYITKAGAIVWVDISIAVIRDGNETPVNYVAVLKDITNKKRTITELSEANAFNKMIVETSPVGIVSVNANGEITFANKRAELLLGLTKDDIKQLNYNAPAWKITDIDGGPFPENQLPFVRVMETKLPVNNIRHAIEWPNGERVYLSINARPQLDENENFKGIVASIEDISDKLEAENLIKSKNAFLNAIILNAAEGLCVCHNCKEYPFVKFTVWNDKMMKLTGYSMEEINKLGWYQTLYQDTEMREKAMKRMQNMRMGDDIAGEEWLITRKDKQKRIVSIATSIISIDGDEVNVMALMNDVTEKHNTKTAIEEANKKLKEINDSKDRFFEILAHDLKGPLGASLALSKHLYENSEEHKIEEDTKTFIGNIHESVQRSYSLLEDLLDWSQAQTHKTEFNPQQLNLIAVIEQSIDALADVAKNKHINIQIDSKQYHKLVADEKMIRTVLRNLINNAIKYSSPGGKVFIKVQNLDNQSVISVIDNGIGIESDRLKFLFRMNKSISTKGTADEKGTGLGLLLCKELVNYHKGKIWAESKTGVGSSFSFSIPQF
ncbi:MAG: PAS domain S-box protein [Bacteroidales bacterium]|nr:PAS domain S-box protein [Bacteroidales bacterium]MBN2818391.1 PAS domain S-box protein [Bacteroidales bacterium]